MKTLVFDSIRDIDFLEVTNTEEAKGYLKDNLIFLLKKCPYKEYVQYSDGSEEIVEGLRSIYTFYNDEAKQEYLHQLEEYEEWERRELPF